MALVTLIGEKLAKEGNKFMYLGPQNDCKNCKLKTVCFNLRPGIYYQITKVRDKKHNCNIHEGNAVVVEVKKMPIITAIDTNYSEGKKTKIEKKECKNIGCENYKLCYGIKIQKDKEYTIEKIIDKINCPNGYNLNKVEITD